MNKRVVVTGVGMVTPIGVGKEIFSQNLFGGVSGIREIALFDTSRHPCHYGAEIIEYSPKDFISSKNIRKMDILSRAAVASARIAADDAGIVIDEKNRDRTGVVLGVALGSVDISVQVATTMFFEGPTLVNPIVIPNVVMNAPAGHISIELGFRGVNSTINHKEASAETAIAHAASEIRRGTADVMFAGGADLIAEKLFETLIGFSALARKKDGGEERARPFDVHRNGMSIGEGAGVICLESYEHAERRGARAYAEIAGWGMSAAPSPLNDWPDDPKGPVLALERALRSAGIEAKDVQFISASANGGKRLDRLEALALDRVFSTNKPFISSLKGAIGESLSSGGMRAAALLLSMERGAIPKTLGLLDPIMPLNFVMNENRDVKIENALLNGFSSGGTFISVVLRKS